MVRKTTRSAALKASEKAKRESPRRTRRKKSSSKSESSDDEVLSKIKERQTVSQVEKESSGNESDTDSRKPLKKRTRSMAIKEAKKAKSETDSSVAKLKETEQQELKEEVIEENTSKGKSKSRSNIAKVHVETENENMQVTDESPNSSKDDKHNSNDDRQSKNGTEIETIDVNISQVLVAEMSCDNQSSDITTEETAELVVSKHSESASISTDDNSADLTQTNAEEINNEKADVSKEAFVILQRESSEKATESVQENVSSKDAVPDTQNASDVSKKIKLNRILRSKTIEIQQESEELDNNKKIKLKRPEIKSHSTEEEKPQEHNVSSSPKKAPEEDEWGSRYESKADTNKEAQNVENIDDKPSRKKITLKRTTTDESSVKDKKEPSLERSISLPERTDKRRSSRSDNIIINERERRRSSGYEKSANESEDKPQKVKKPTKVVKLIRKLMEESQEPPPPGEEIIKKFKWTLSKKPGTPIESVNLNALQEVCSSIQFLNEDEVNLDISLRDVKSPEKSRRKTFKELEDEEMENIQAELDAEPEETELTKDNIIALNRKISIVEDTASKLNPPPSPAKNPISEVLFISNLVRPFTIKQLKELLERTGKIKEDGFWTDRIKSKCYVCYETAEEAESTRNALHGVHWPIGNGKKLIIDYATVEDMEIAKNPPIVVHRTEKSPEKENKKPDIEEDQRDRQNARATKREWDIGKEDQRRSHSRSRERKERRHSRRSYTPEDAHKRHKFEEPVPQKAMDDLFLKTKATPSIYWQPLSPEEIARKQQQRQARLEENKRRLEEIRSSGRGGVRDRNARDRDRRDFRRR